MSREIKFRAWDSHNKLMLSDVMFQNLSTGHLSVIVWKSRHQSFSLHGKWGWKTDDNGHLYNDICMTLMQYTGLKDKNGVEIYEGDIVKAGDDVMTVGWSDSLASFVLTKNGWLWPHYFGEAVEPENVEVSGNIHQNPELLDPSQGGVK